MKYVVVIDDMQISRRVAEFELAGCRGVLVPASPADIDKLDPSDIGLLVLDRNLIGDWKRATDALINRLDPETKVIEWTAATSLCGEKPRKNTVLTIPKTGFSRELRSAVMQWLRNGTIIGMSAS